MGLLSEWLTGGAASLVSAVGDAIDKNMTTDEERKALESEMQKAEWAHREKVLATDLAGHVAEMQDTADARMNQTKVQESDKASWLSKNVHPILAFLIMAAMFGMFGFLVFRETPAANRDVVMLVIGSVTTIGTQVVSYFFGSSSGSAAKNKLLGGDKS